MDRYDELEDATWGMSPEQTLAFLGPLAESGDAAAQCLLADAYDDGTMGHRDSVKSVQWYRKSAAQGFLRAQFYLGSMIYFGFGTPQDLAEAAYWFRIAAERGDSAAQFRLGEMLAHGSIDGEPNVAEGIAWLERSANQGHESAVELLKTLRNEG